MSLCRIFFKILVIFKLFYYLLHSHGYKEANELIRTHALLITI